MTVKKTAKIQGKKPPPTSGKDRIKGYLKKEIDSALYTRKLESYIQRRNIKIALGVGKLDNFLEHFENGFYEVAPTDPKLPYGKDFNRRPKIRRISSKTIKKGG